MDRTDLRFHSRDAHCAAWLYRPVPTGGDAPCVVMAHGFSLTRHDGLARYAEAFCAAGFAVLLYDHRHLGDSDGRSRQRVDLAEMLEDRRAAVTFARRLPGVDPDRIVVWGFSMSAGSAVEVAATDPRIVAAVLVCPLLDGRWRAKRGLLNDPGNVAWMIAQAAKDTMGYAVISATAPPGQRGMLNDPGEADGFAAIVADGSPWRNEVRAAPTRGYSNYRPGVHAGRVHCPVLINAGHRDITVSPAAVERFARQAPRAEVRRYDIDHFGAFHGDPSRRIATDQADWLRGHSAATARRDAS